jgi:hypothetical protein
VVVVNIHDIVYQSLLRPKGALTKETEAHNVVEKSSDMKSLALDSLQT